MKVNTTSIIIIVIIIRLGIYLIYSHNKSNKIIITNPDNRNNNNNLHEYYQELQKQREEQILEALSTHRSESPIVSDKYVDPIKQNDMESLYDVLSYPQLRLPRDVLKKYEEYYEKNGNYPGIGKMTQPIFDNPVLNGVLIKQTDDREIFNEQTPITVPLFKLKSAKNVNRFFYYIIDQRYLSKLELKIPLDNIKINGIRYSNSDFYGLPELYDDDIIENIPIFPGSAFKVLLYKTHHFP